MRKAIVTLALSAFVLSGCSFDVKLPPLTSESATESAAQLIELAVTQTNESATQIDLVDELTYPKFSVTSGGAVAQTVSDELNSEIALQVEDFKVRAADALPDTSVGSTLNIVVRNIRQTSDFVAYNIFNCEYIAGAAHGYCFGWTYAFSAVDAAPISLIDAISAEDRTAFYDFIEQKIFDQIETDLLFEPDFIELGENSFNSWWLSDGYATIQFAPYEVAPYATGEVEIYLESAELENFLTPDSALFKLLTASE